MSEVLQGFTDTAPHLDTHTQKLQKRWGQRGERCLPYMGLLIVLSSKEEVLRLLKPFQPAPKICRPACAVSHMPLDRGL